MDNRCDSYTDMVLAHLEAQPNLKVVILHARWPFHLHGTGYDNGEGGFHARNAEVLAAFAALPDHPRLHVLHPYEMLCDTELTGRCIASRDGLPLYADPDHLTNRAATPLVDALFPLVLAAR